MLRRAVKDHLIGEIVQEGCTTFHRAQDTTLTFDTQYLCSNPFLLGYPTHQCFGLMDIQVIQHDVPFAGMRIAGNQALEMSQRILLVAGRSPGGSDDLSSRDIEIDEPGERSMSDIFTIASEHMG